jgi:hypothetical protein
VPSRHRHPLTHTPTNNTPHLQTPKCSAITTGNDDKLKAAAACSGSLVAIANACSKAATSDACSATNSKCAWTEGVCHHADLPTSLAGSVASALTGLQSVSQGLCSSPLGMPPLALRDNTACVGSCE